MKMKKVYKCLQTFNNGLGAIYMLPPILETDK